VWLCLFEAMSVDEVSAPAGLSGGIIDPPLTRAKNPLRLRP
jgi:hypothetical protein